MGPVETAKRIEKERHEQAKRHLRRIEKLEAALLAAINLAAALLKPDNCIDRLSAGQVLGGLRNVLDEDDTKGGA